MAPKKLKKEGNQTSIADFYPKGNAAAGSSCSTPRKTSKAPENEVNPKKVKTEKMDEVETPEDEHTFNVKFDKDDKEYKVTCTHRRTVLQVIKSHLPKQFKEKIKKPDEKITIKLGKGSDASIVATHFPCSCIEKSECLTLKTSNYIVEKKQQESVVLSRENYSVFFIDKEGGKDTKTKTDRIFRCNNITEKFRYFCIYERKGKTVSEALKLDGRFVDDLKEFKLSDNKTGDYTLCTELVNDLDGRTFRVCLPKEGMVPKQQEQVPTQQTRGEQQEKNPPGLKQKTTTVLQYAEENRVSVKEAARKTGSDMDLKEIMELLKQQFPGLKEWMESRFPKHSFKEALNLKQENFGKIQNSFSEVSTVRQLVKLSESVCFLKIKESSSEKGVMGTGFLLFGNFVLTNCHLFDAWIKTRKENWRDYITISAEFNFEKSDCKPKRTFQANALLGTDDFDFALLELSEMQTSDQTETQKTEPEKLPEGLLKRFGPLPKPQDDGGACIIGHPAGEVKKMDITCVIRKEDREQVVTENLESYKDDKFVVYSINYQIKRDPRADIFVTYNTFMYHGASGSPVFDAWGRVFGLHSGGFYYDVIPKNSIVEFAFPLLDVFKKLLVELQKNHRVDLLGKIRKEAQGNLHLENILESANLKQSNDQQQSDSS